jgi:hypothetical protein
VKRQNLLRKKDKRLPRESEIWYGWTGARPLALSAGNPPACNICIVPTSWRLILCPSFIHMLAELNQVCRLSVLSPGFRQNSATIPVRIASLQAISPATWPVYYECTRILLSVVTYIADYQPSPGVPSVQGYYIVHSKNCWNSRIIICTLHGRHLQICFLLIHI